MVKGGMAHRMSAAQRRAARRIAAAAALMLIIVGCDERAERSTRSSADAATSGAPAVPPAHDSIQHPVDPDRLIRRDGIAHAAAGMTIGDLRAALPPGISLGPPRPYMVDIAGMPVVEDGDTLYLVLIPNGEPSGDAARINLLATTDTTFRTLEGIGPGSTLAEAAARYGDPTLAYSTNDESREYATFPALPPTIRVRVRPTSDTASFAGIYTTAAEYNETTRHDPGFISMVLVFSR